MNSAKVSAWLRGGRLYRAVYRVVRLFIKPYVRKKYGFSTDLVPKMSEPYLMVSNHTTEEDMFFCGLASRQPMCFVCGEHLLRKGYGRLLRTLADPIPVPKGGTAVRASIEIMKRLRAGVNVCMFPEGKRSFHGVTIPSSEALGTLVKKAGCALVTYRIRGGYFTYPRWARGHHRKGRVDGGVAGVYSSGQLAEMSAAEITELINRDTFEDAVETQRTEMRTYTGTDRAKGMELLLFICPSCGAWDSLETSGDSFVCSACGRGGVYNDYGFLEGDGAVYDNVRDWMKFTEAEFDRRVASLPGDCLVAKEENVLLYRMLDGYENEDVCRGEATVFRDRIEAGGFIFPFREITALSILYGNILFFTHKKVYWGITGDGFKAWKCGRLWHLEKGDTNDRTREM